MSDPRLKEMAREWVERNKLNKGHAVKDLRYLSACDTDCDGSNCNYPFVVEATTALLERVRGEARSGHAPDCAGSDPHRGQYGECGCGYLQEGGAAAKRDAEWVRVVRGVRDVPVHEAPRVLSRRGTCDEILKRMGVKGE